MDFERISDGGISRPKGAYRAAQAAYRAAGISNSRRGYIDKKRSVDMSRRANPSGLDICLTAFDISLRTRYTLRASSILGNGEQHLGLGSAEMGHTAVVKDHGSGKGRKPCGFLFSIRMELNSSVRTNFTRAQRVFHARLRAFHTPQAYFTIAVCRASAR